MLHSRHSFKFLKLKHPEAFRLPLRHITPYILHCTFRSLQRHLTTAPRRASTSPAICLHRPSERDYAEFTNDSAGCQLLDGTTVFPQLLQQVLERQLGRAVQPVFKTNINLLVGRYHQNFEFEDSVGTTYMARFRFRKLIEETSYFFTNDQPSCLLTESEVATLLFVAENTSIPVPQPILFDSQENNPIGAEYMVYRKLPGKRLADVWEDLTFEAKKAILFQLADFQSQLVTASRPLSKFGSFSLRLESNCSYRVTIGLTMQHHWWHGPLGEMDIDRGPWNEHHEFVLSALHREQARFTRIAELMKNKEYSNMWYDELADTYGPDAILSSLEAARPLIPELFLPPIPQESFLPHRPHPNFQPLLHHPDLLTNILVDLSDDQRTLSISGIIDWERAAIIPSAFTLCIIPEIIHGMDVETHPDDEEFPPEKGSENWERRYQYYENTQLRKFWRDQLRQRGPETGALADLEYWYKTAEWNPILRMVELLQNAHFWPPGAWRTLVLKTSLGWNTTMRRTSSFPCEISSEKRARWIKGFENRNSEENLRKWYGENMTYVMEVLADPKISEEREEEGW
ncbi:hypothetical protein BT69DRAFT_1287811 [Atractiella rhizophila]|nr:hypothetical protein BT69DRAFT_1287811 [Atractiella rhizophila]